MTNADKIERKKMLLAMEFIARQVNDEDVMESWLRCGVPDGDIQYGNFDVSQIYDEDTMLEDDDFKDIMTVFLRMMKNAWKSGGLYCGGVVSDDYESSREKYK